MSSLAGSRPARPVCDVRSLRTLPFALFEGTPWSRCRRSIRGRRGAAILRSVPARAGPSVHRSQPPLRAGSRIVFRTGAPLCRPSLPNRLSSSCCCFSRPRRYAARVLTGSYTLCFFQSTSSSTASFLATATTARFFPFLPPLAARPRPQLPRSLCWPKGPRMRCAHWTRSRRSSASPHLLMRSCGRSRRTASAAARGPRTRRRREDRRSGRDRRRSARSTATSPAPRRRRSAGATSPHASHRARRSRRRTRGSPRSAPRRPRAPARPPRRGAAADRPPPASRKRPSIPKAAARRVTSPSRAQRSRAASARPPRRPASAPRTDPPASRGRGPTPDTADPSSSRPRAPAAPRPSRRSCARSSSRRRDAARRRLRPPDRPVAPTLRSIPSVSPLQHDPRLPRQSAEQLLHDLRSVPTYGRSRSSPVVASRTRPSNACRRHRNRGRAA